MNELYHHGVLGMKWGVRHDAKRYAAARLSGNERKADKARASLENRQESITRKLGKLDKKEAKLTKRVERYEAKSALKAQRLETKSANLAKKAGRSWSSTRRYNLYRRSERMHYDAQSIKLKGAQHKAGLKKVQRMKEQYNKGLVDVNDALRDSGRYWVAQQKKLLGAR